MISIHTKCVNEWMYVWMYVWLCFSFSSHLFIYLFARLFSLIVFFLLNFFLMSLYLKIVLRLICDCWCFKIVNRWLCLRRDNQSYYHCVDMPFHLTHEKKKHFKYKIFKRAKTEKKRKMSSISKHRTNWKFWSKKWSKCEEFSVLINKWYMNRDKYWLHLHTSTPIRIVFISICIDNWKNELKLR